VPFFWTLHLLPHVLLTSGLLLGVFYGLDRRAHRHERAGSPPTPSGRHEPIRIAGGLNLALLAGVVGVVLLSGSVDLGTITVAGLELAKQNLLRDLGFVFLAAVSLAVTPRGLRTENQFGWSPLREVAILFAGIFVTIVPALAILSAGDKGDLSPLLRAAATPWKLFWITGGLSSFLDNAPTYLTFLSAALGRYYADQPAREAITLLIAEHGIVLEAISAGAVFMGAMTYIGNAPNFMVRSIAEEAGVAMPSFFGYLLRWSLPVLVPIFVLVTLVFFR
jgi:Na+/H+ antiporter NhaD/arsenite permease-like protein